MPEIEIVSRPGGAVSGAAGAAPERPRVEIVMSPETGAETVNSSGSKAPSRAQSIAKIRAAAEKGGSGKGKDRADAAGSGAEGDDDPGAGDEAGEETDDQEDAGSEADDAGDAAEGEEGDAAPEGDEEAAEEDDAAAEGDEEEEEEEAPPKKQAKKDDDVDPSAIEATAESETLKREVETLREKLAQTEAGLLGEDAREAYFENPGEFVQGMVARLFGLEKDDPDLKKEVHALLTDLTVLVSGAGISAENLAQIESDRVTRAWKLGKKGRKAQEKAAAERTEREAAENYVDSVFVKAAADKFPFVALATDLDGIKPGKAVLDTARWAVAKGIIKADGKDETAILTEALRLTNHRYKARFEKLSARYTAKPQKTEHASAGDAGPKPGQPKNDASATKKKPRTLSAAEAGTATSAKKPGASKKPEGPKQIVVVRDPDAEQDRRRAIFEKHRKSNQRK